jgi:hypothetical protein
MKKYLMTGMAAIAFCAAFTSCSKNDDLYDPNAINEMEAAQVYEAYNQAFIATFGQVHPSQDWGFGSHAGTRSENANANEWADPDKEYGGLLVPPAITDKQAAVVREYFQTHRNLDYNDPQWTNYFIQQVYKGYTAPKTGTDPNTNKPYSPEKYLAADGGTWIYASNNMDHLAAINGTFVDHINNFNHGDCSPNGDVLDNGQHVGGTHHTDKIMYMKNSTTASFGYYNSNGSVRRTEYTGLVGWETIHNWALTNYPGYDGCLNDDWNRSYMGFDFEQMVGPEIFVDAYYSYGGKQYQYLNSNMNMYCGDLKEFNDLNGVDIAGLLADGYLPVQNSADKKWVKVGGCADGYYSDWIVTLTEAKTRNTPDPTVVRIMAEDLNATAIKDQGDIENSDWDFNDVVFDVKFDETGTGGTITLVCAGGVLPLEVAGVEVHTKFDPSLTQDEKGWYPMINTGGYGAISRPRVSFHIDDADKANNGYGISIVVYKQHKDGTWHPYELTARQGQPAAKFAVKPIVQPLGERVHIDYASDGAFSRAVQEGGSLNYLWW